MERCDILIVGAGPAGAAAALRLAVAGRDVLLVEKEPLPRDKLCAGMLTPKSCTLLHGRLAELGLELPDGLLTPLDRRVRYHLRNRQLCETRLGHDLVITPRREFDHALVKAAVAAGTRLCDHAGRVAIESAEATRVTLADGTEIAYERVIAADGALSRSRRLVAPAYSAGGFCLEAVSPWSRPDDRITRLFFGCCPYGYGWVFPAADRVVVGIGGMQPGLGHWRTFVAMLADLDIPVTVPPTPRGAFVPFGPPPTRATAGRLLLAGDAAGLVNPATGEGICHALASGLAAADAILAGGDVTRRYERSLRPMRIRIRADSRLRHLLYWPPVGEPLLHTLGRSTIFMRLASQAVMG